MSCIAPENSKAPHRHLQHENILLRGSTRPLVISRG